MGGGSLSESIILSLTDHLNKTLAISGDTAVVQPGVYYRDFEKLTLEKGLLFPAYPASREICAFGGMIADNCGGEKSLEYGKAERYVQKLKMVLADGKTYDFFPLNEAQLNEKLALTTFEGDLYKRIFKLITDNYDLIASAKPKVSKNSAGYAIWDVYDKNTKIFDMTKLFVGSQGTLGIFTEATVKLVPIKTHSQMLVVYMYDRDMAKLGQIINTVLEYKPESFETYDDNTLKLALNYFPEFQKKLGTGNVLSTALHFLPEFIMSLMGKLPKLVLQIEFGGNDVAELKGKVAVLQQKLTELDLATKAVGDEKESKKYWLIRRESFRLLKEKIKDKYASPFIDDIVVNPKYLSEFLPKFSNLIAKYPSIISTTAGHIGDGNFHIIPLVDIASESERKIIGQLGKEVYDLVAEYHGTTNGEHNDGLIRTPYLRTMFGDDVVKLFLQIKTIFDPSTIFNPGKKTDVSLEYAMSHIRRSW
jgi:FAD/FMN-containing dehydrogenase